MAELSTNFDREGRLRFAQVTDKTSRDLREFWTIVQPQLPSILDGFYAQATTEPSLARLVGGQIDRLKNAQSMHWQRLFSGTFDQSYMEGIHRIGLAHKKINLEPRWYMAGYKFVLNRLVGIAIAKYRWSPKRLQDILSAVNTAILLDMDLAISAYLAVIEQAKNEQTQLIVNSIGAGLDALAKGDLTHRVTSELEGPFVKLKEDFNNALVGLQDAMKAALSSTASINSGAGEIAAAADDLSRRTEQQAASLEQTAAALEQITATVKRTAQNATEAGTLVSKAKSAAQEGGQVVETAIKAMSQIEQSSKQITDIIGVIDEIAFQTNLLALNAGVEAARAGDAGKGFAVVASEVRALAQRSSEAAKEIKTLIKTSSEHVSSGVKFVDETGRALKNIVEQVVAINTLVSEMAQAAQQQSTGIEEVNGAVTQMDQVTQQNAGMVEESTAASRNLANETSELSERISFFKVGDMPRAAKSPTAPARQAPVAPVRLASKLSPSRPLSSRRGSAAVAVNAKPQPADQEWQEF
jgi:methyl-accepting chemotaxis protein